MARGKSAPSIPRYWTRQERWIYGRLVAGEIADLNEMEGVIRDPKDNNPWPDERMVTPRFLKDVILDNPISQNISHQGVRITGAWFKDIIDLQNAKLAHPLFLESSRFDYLTALAFAKSDFPVSFIGSRFSSLSLLNLNCANSINLNSAQCAGLLSMGGVHVGKELFINKGAIVHEVDLKGARVDGQLSISGSRVAGKLNMNGIFVGKGIFLRDCSEYNMVDLKAARVAGQLDIATSTVFGKLDMSGLHVEKSLHMNNDAAFNEVDMTGAKIDGQLDMTGSTFAGILLMNGLQVGDGLFIRNGAEFKEVDLTGAIVDGQLSMKGSKVTGKLNLNGLHVGNDLLLSNGIEFNEVNLAGAKIDGQLEITGSKFNGQITMEHISVGATLFCIDSEFGEKSSFDILFGHIKGSFVLSGSKSLP